MIHIRFETKETKSLPSASKLNHALSLGLKKVSFEWFSRVIKRNPVDTGRSRAAWRINPSSNTSYHINNNMKYIKFLEYGLLKGKGSKITTAGYSTQAKEGMVRISLRELKPLANGIMLKYLEKL